MKKKVLSTYKKPYPEWACSTITLQLLLLGCVLHHWTFVSLDLNWARLQCGECVCAPVDG